MQIDCKTVFLVVFIFCCSSLEFARAQEIKVTHIANAGLSLSDGVSTFYIDFPYKSGFFMYAKYNRSELVKIKDSSVLLFTHRHPDHYSLNRVRKLRKHGKCRVFGPWNDQKVSELNHEFQDFSIQTFRTGHNLSKRHNSYLIVWHGKRIFVSGDTEQADTLAAIKGLDWVFGPVWLLMDAMKKELKIDTQKFGVYHVGKNDKITIDNPKYQILGKQGEEIVIPY